MKLIFVTQVLDAEDAVLGFVSRWVAGLGAHADRVRVIALEVGKTRGLPDNVDWRVLGRKGAVRRYFRYRRALREAFSEGFDGLLTHMVPRYSNVAAPFARRAGVPHFLWYTHKGVDARLLRAIGLVDGVFTASLESLRVETPKRIVTGHGIDAAPFDLPPVPDLSKRARLLSVGRMTPAKDPVTILRAVHALRESGRDVTLSWVGGGLARGDDDYQDMVHDLIQELGLRNAVTLRGSVPHTEVPAAYAASDIFVSASRTGSVDKVVLEAMAARRPVLSSNESIPPLFAGDRDLAPVASSFSFAGGDVGELCAGVAEWMDRPHAETCALGDKLRDLVERDHDVDRLMERLVKTIAAGRAASSERGGPS